MTFGKYVKDKLFAIIAGVLFWLVLTIFFVSFHMSFSFILFATILFLIFSISVFLWEFFRRRNFYNHLFWNLDRLDQKYLLLETLEKPDFYDGELLCQALYEMDKSMCENVRSHQHSLDDFKEYIEMWVHEVKIPIASLLLMCHNNKDTIAPKYARQIRRLAQYTDQVLYYVRSEHPENDYLIKKEELGKLVKKAVIQNKEDLLENKIDINVEEMNQTVMTDGKWFEFILNQILNNSIKYKSDKRQPVIHIFAEELPALTILHIKDNGIGICEGDLPNVFKKSFTGENGRCHAKSTGMGLYIVKRLCGSLGHGIEIKSVAGEYTEVIFSFVKNDYYFTS